MHRTQSRVRTSQSLERVRKAARLRKKEQFTALFHHINVNTLRTAFYALRRKAAPGVDGMIWHGYEADLEFRLKVLYSRVHSGGYRPQPFRRTFIPKADGRQRPLAIAALDDKIVQGATAIVLDLPLIFSSMSDESPGLIGGRTDEAEAVCGRAAHRGAA